MRRAGFVALCLLLATGFAALGAWQVERLRWKRELIARVDARIHAAPRPFPGRAERGEDLAYTRVRVTGRFLHDREALVQALTVRGAGFWVMTPLRTDSATVLVNRGFVPAERRSPSSRAAGQVEGETTVVGLIRSTEAGGAFLRSNDPAADRWYSRDVRAIATARALSGEVAPVFIDADAAPNPGGYPVGGLTVIAFPNKHLIYAVTWFALAALSAGGAALAARRR